MKLIKPLSRAEMDALLRDGWTQRRAWLSETMPVSGGCPKNLRYVDLGGGNIEPRIFTEPK